MKIHQLPNGARFEYEGEEYGPHGLGENVNERDERAAGHLERVGLSKDALHKYPYQFYGGEKQRIAIARCLTVEPRIFRCDECVSALDASIQVQVPDLLQDLQDDFGLPYLFISHDLAVIRFIADRVLVVYDGKIVESADTESIHVAPVYAYTSQLISAMPLVDHWM